MSRKSHHNELMNKILIDHHTSYTPDEYDTGNTYNNIQNPLSMKAR